MMMILAIGFLLETWLPSRHVPSTNKNQRPQIGGCLHHLSPGRLGADRWPYQTANPLLNLGTNFSLAKEKWPELCARIEQILAGRGALFPLAGDIEQEAHRYAALLIGKGGAEDRRDENGSSFD